MGTRLIGYDLKEGEDYEALITAIKGLGAWWHHLDSTWLVKTDLTAMQVREQLRPHLKQSDELLVVDVTGAARAWWGFNDSGSKWLKETF